MNNSSDNYSILIIYLFNNFSFLNQNNINILFVSFSYVITICNVIINPFLLPVNFYVAVCLHKSLCRTNEPPPAKQYTYHIFTFYDKLCNSIYVCILSPI